MVVLGVFVHASRLIPSAVSILTRTVPGSSPNGPYELAFDLAFANRAIGDIDAGGKPSFSSDTVATHDPQISSHNWHSGQKRITGVCNWSSFFDSGFLSAAPIITSKPIFQKFSDVCQHNSPLWYSFSRSRFTVIALSRNDWLLFGVTAVRQLSKKF